MPSSSPTLLYETLHGSRAFNLATASSDRDIKGIIVGPRSWYFGFHDAPEQLDLSKDHVHYEVRKLVRLAVAANPMALEMLYAPPAAHLTVTPAVEPLLAARDLFLSKRVGKTFGGYALGQLRRIRTHRRWLLEPPVAEPTRADFGLPSKTTLPRDQLGALEALASRGELDAGALTPNFLALLDRERGYRAARREWEQYRDWRRRRNPARAALEARFGYDTKHAQHLVRLLRMGVEILTTHEVHVHREDREELLHIRRGGWTYEELDAYAAAAQAALSRAEAASTLPERPDEERVSALCVDLVDATLRGRAP